MLSGAASETMSTTLALPSRAVPSRADALLFRTKTTVLRGLRGLRETLDGTRAAHHGAGGVLAEAPVVATVRSPLWTGLAGEKDRALTAGKVQNLRVALRGIDGVEVPAGAVFSFWRQVGRATRRRGFVAGRELREGCLVSSVGGGLCQLSNALYEAALQAGFEIVERHAHSRVVPGSRAQAGRDATVFWNYVDLRFRSPRPFRIEARMTADALELVLRSGVPGVLDRLGEPAAPDGRGDAHDCTSCGQTSCRLNNPDTALTRHLPTAWLLDAATPEFAALFAERATRRDALVLPTRLFGGPRYGWARGRCGAEASADLAALRRSLALRRAPQGAALQARILEADDRLAASHARRLSHLHTHLVVSQNLLPHLWRLGALQGRSFEVLMERLPLDVLQAQLDEALARHPESLTLGDFRAPDAVVAAERAALDAAARLITAHRGIAALFPGRTQLLDWAAAAPLASRRGGRAILLPASALGRKGVHALRAAITGLDIEVLVQGGAVEHAGFWGNRPVRRLMPGEAPAELAAVVLPAIVEHQPRALLRALAAGIPVIATAACGLGERDGLTVVPADDPAALRAAIAAVL